MKALIIYNRFSGKSSNKEIEYIKNKLYKKYDIIDVHEVKYDIREYVIRNSSKYELLIVIGGDGTINQAINGLMLVNIKPLVAYIPMGTCNDFGRTVGLKTSLDKVINNIINENYRLINVNTDYYLYGLAVGNMTNVSYNINPILKRIFGRLGYYLNIFKHIFKDESFELMLNVDNVMVNEECFCLMLLNTKYLASKRLRLNNDYINNEKIKIVLIKKRNRIINIVDLVLFFLIGEKYNHNINYYEGYNINITTKDLVRFNVDGESLPLLNKVNVNRNLEVIKLITNN